MMKILGKVLSEKDMESFIDMVIEGWFQGLYSPNEIISSYSRCIGIAYKDINDRDKFIKTACDLMDIVEGRDGVIEPKKRKKK
jgi:hypothetical protein